MPPTPRHVFNDIAPSRARPVYIPSQHATDRATRLHIIVEGHTLRTKKEAWKLAAPLLSYGMREVKPGLWMTSLNLQNKWRLVNCVIDWIETGKYAMPMFINPADPNVYTKRVKCHMFMMLFAKDTCGSSQLFLYAADQIIHEVRANFTPLAFAEFMAVFYETINDLSAYLKRELLQFTWEILPELRTLADETCIQLISNGFLEDFVLICNQCINIDCMEIFSPFESKWLKLEDGFLQAIGDLLCGTPSLTDVSTDDESEID